ncbi:MAG: undecaprenyl-diphosphate phosphatase [bacterium]
MESANFFNSIVAGIIQGVSELFPVSSSGHLILFSHLTNLNLEIADIAILHLGTLLAIIVGMWDKIKEIKAIKTLLKIVISTIPGVIVGFLVQDYVDEYLSANWIIATSLLFWGIVMIIVDQISKKKEFKTTEISQVSTFQAIVVGLGQVIAFIPGTSRSGIATIAGIVSGIKPKIAVEYGFLAGLILIPGKGVLSLIQGIEIDVSAFLIGLATIVSATIGYIVIQVFRTYIDKRILTCCGVYRILLGAVILLFF